MTHNRSIRAMRAAIFLIVMFAVVGVIAPHRAKSQGTPDHFTIIGVPDIHYYLTNGSTLDGGTFWDTYEKPFITAAFGDTTWNARAVMGLGDMISECTNVGPIGEWQQMAADWQAFSDLGYAVTVAAGNHDSCSPGSLANGGVNWNTYISPQIATLGLTTVFDMFSHPPFSATWTVGRGMQYRRLDVTTSAGTIKMGLIGAPIFPVVADLTTLANDVDTDRELIYGTHMFVSENSGFHGGHPCSNASVDTDCTFNTNTDYADGAAQWNILKALTKLRLIFNGHSHNDAQLGMHSAQMTGTSSNVVEAFSTSNASKGNKGSLLLARFYVSNASGACTSIGASSCIQIYSWKTAVGAPVGTADSSFFGAPVVIPWAVPSIVPVAPTVTTTSLTGGTIGSLYGAQLAATGDTPITWSLVSGTLPWGLSLSSSGAITGTPHVIVAANITVRATNATDHNDKALTLTIAPVVCKSWTLTYRDLDCDGYGVGKRADGVYTFQTTDGSIGEGSSTYDNAVGDLPDADDDDPSVHSTAQWEAVWGSGSVGIAQFLQSKYAFTNSGRMRFISQTGTRAGGPGSASTGAGTFVDPYRYVSPVPELMRDGLGGVAVVRGGTWDDLEFSPCDFPIGGITQSCAALWGTSAHPAYVMVYPGEQVITSRGLNNNTTYFPGTNVGYITFDGFTFRSPIYGDAGDAFKADDTQFFTVRNCEFVGWHEISFGVHSEDTTVQENVIHNNLTHAIYFQHSLAYSTPYGAADFDFPDDAARYIAGTSPGASYRATIEFNTIYNCGYSGFEAIHVNAYIDGVVVRNNVVSFCSGGGIGLDYGVYHAEVYNNVVVNVNSAAMLLILYGTVASGEVPATIRYVKIYNNIFWSGVNTDLIRGGHPGVPIIAYDYSEATGRWIRDVDIYNNIILSDNWDPAFGNPAMLFERSAYIDTFTVHHNLFFNHAPGANVSTDFLVKATNEVTTSAYQPTYTFAELNTKYGGAGANLYGDPKFGSTITQLRSYSTTPNLADFSLRSTSPAIGAGTATGSPTNDYWSVTRPSPPSMGAFEFYGTPAVGHGARYSGRTATSGHRK